MKNLIIKDEKVIEGFEKEIVELIEKIGNIGKDPEGGTTRLTYSETWKEAQLELNEIMVKAGLSTHFDTAGSLYGHLEGLEEKDRTVMSGSHIDTVKCGGHFDGLFGILGSFIAIKYLKEKYGNPKRNLSVVSIAEEEGSRFSYSYWGASNIVGNVNSEKAMKTYDSDGVGLMEAMKEVGFDQYDKDKNKRDDIVKFVEMHIEQGGVLERESKAIGIVKSIVGQKRYIVTIEGEANHAGTTPLSYRKDAMKTASEFIYKLHQKLDEYGEPLVATVGKIITYPNTPNVVPGKVVFYVDIRHPIKSILDEFEKEIGKIFESVKEYKTDIKMEKWMDESPTELNKEIGKLIEDSCNEEEYSYMDINSGAGHDSEVMARKYDTAMIFVPSKDGISHSPLEYTTPKELAKGIVILTKVLYNLAY